MQESRYSRLEKLKVLGPTGLDPFQEMRIAVIGLGGTGSQMASLLCRAGVSSLTIIDRDYVEESNLHRQLLYFDEDIGKRKVDAAETNLKMSNPGTRINKIFGTFDAGKADSLLSDVDLVMDGTDNITSRLILNDACVKMRIPWIYTSALETYGQVKAILPGKSSCFACFNDIPINAYPTCEQIGVLSSIPSIVADFAFILALRISKGVETGSELYHYEGWPPAMQSVRINRAKNCRSCVRNEYRYLSSEYSGLDFRPLL